MDAEAANANALSPTDVRHFEEVVRDKEEFKSQGWCSDRYIASCYGKSRVACWYHAKNGEPRPKLEGNDE